MKLIMVIVISAFLVACTHAIQFTHFETGESLVGEYNELNKTVTVVMPNGEVLSGKYSAMTNASFSFVGANAYTGTTYASGTGYGMSVGGTSKAYALLKSSSSKLMMEIIVDYSEWSGSGYGEARTNDNRNYKVQF